MQAEGMLELVAEIAIGFAGFSGIVGVYRTHTDASHDPRADLRLLVEYSIFLLTLSMLPLFLWNFGLTENGAWRAASLAAGLLNAAYYAIRQRQILASAAEQHIAASMRVYIVLDWSLIVLLLINSTGVFPWAPAIFYLGNLAYQLSGSALTFVRFIAPLWKPAAQQGDEVGR